MVSIIARVNNLFAAKNFIETTGYKLPMVVDAMDNSFVWKYHWLFFSIIFMQLTRRKYYAHPERFFVIKDGKLSFKARPHGAYYMYVHEKRKRRL